MLINTRSICVFKPEKRPNKKKDGYYWNFAITLGKDKNGKYKGTIPAYIFKQGVELIPNQKLTNVTADLFIDIWKGVKYPKLILIKWDEVKIVQAPITPLGNMSEETLVKDENWDKLINEYAGEKIFSEDKNQEPAKEGGEE